MTTPAEELAKRLEELSHRRAQVVEVMTSATDGIAQRLAVSAADEADLASQAAALLRQQASRIQEVERERDEARELLDVARINYDYELGRSEAAEARIEALEGVLRPLLTVCVRVGQTTREDVDAINAARAVLNRSDG